MKYRAEYAYKDLPDTWYPCKNMFHETEHDLSTCHYLLSLVTASPKAQAYGIETRIIPA